MTRSWHSFGGGLLLAATLMLATGCAGANGSAPEATETPGPAPAATSPSPTPLETPTEQPPAADPTCDTIIPANVVTEFEGAGWSARAEPFRIGETTLSDGVHCVWGDFSVATDHVQIFGWAPITASEAAEAQDELISNGWRREQAPDGVLITESSNTTVATDEEGYGLTYLFGDGWVKHADTKQGLLLVVWPKG
jgi:hypothetical protein